MDAVVNFLTPLNLHPVVDHFSVALLIVGVLTDLVGSLFPARMWIRYMALTLMILGAAAAGASYATGDIQTDAIWNQLGDPAKAVLHRHAMLAQYVAIAFAVLALWRILIQALGAFAGTRGVYLIVAIIAAGVLCYVGHLGGVLVYTYGTGTALMAQPSPSASPTPAALPTPSGPLPTVSVPTPLPTPVPTPAAPAASAAPPASTAPAPKPSASATPAPSPTASGV